LDHKISDTIINLRNICASEMCHCYFVAYNPPPHTSGLTLGNTVAKPYHFAVGSRSFIRVSVCERPIIFSLYFLCCNLINSVSRIASFSCGKRAVALIRTKAPPTFRTSPFLNPSSIAILWRGVGDKCHNLFLSSRAPELI